MPTGCVALLNTHFGEQALSPINYVDKDWSSEQRDAMPAVLVWGHGQSLLHICPCHLSFYAVPNRVLCFWLQGS
jgi:hypothetical protein